MPNTSSSIDHIAKSSLMQIHRLIRASILAPGFLTPQPHCLRMMAAAATDAASSFSSSSDFLYHNESVQEISPGLSFVWLDQTPSTQDEARKRMPLPAEVEVLAIGAGLQTQGRGTRGRTWVGKPGNLFLTVVLPVARIPLPLSLVPLRVGVVVAEAIAATTQVSVHLKWPNDVLVKQEKVSGVLIEGDGGKS